MKHIKSHRIVFLVFICTLMCVTPSFGQKEKKPFTGMLEYNIVMRDTALRKLVPANAMRLYTNDTLTRMENFSPQLGSQTTIRHMKLNKSYLLLTVRDSMNFAIKTDLNKADTGQITSKYTYEKKCFKKKHLGMRANRMLVNHPDFEEPIEFLYLKKYSREYLNNFEGIPGLLIKYSVATPDGVIDYELVQKRDYMPNRDLFGVPADYRKVTFDEFMDFMFPESSSSPNQN
ncbi:MAG: hypothetical protein ACFHU9_03770 [Fluviicola sp.]